MQEGLQVLDIRGILQGVGFVEMDVQGVWTNHQPCDRDREQSKQAVNDPDVANAQHTLRVCLGFVSGYSRTENILRTSALLTSHRKRLQNRSMQEAAVM